MHSGLVWTFIFPSYNALDEMNRLFGHLDSGIALLWWQSTNKGLVTVALTGRVYPVLLADRRAEQNQQMQEANSSPQAGLLSTHQLCSCRKALMPGDELA